MGKNGLITTREAAERLEISLRRVRALIEAGRLPSEQYGREHLIKETDLALVAVRKTGRPAKQPAPKPVPSANVQTAKSATAKKKGKEKQAS